MTGVHTDRDHRTGSQPPDVDADADEPAEHTQGHLDAAAMRPARDGPLRDVRVIDLTQALAGPYCTMILADLGADVIKAEAPKGDLPRFLPPFTETDGERAFGGYFASINRNKRGITLDLKDPTDRDRCLRLIDGADVVVENFKAGVMERLGLGYEALAERNPALVYGAIRGFGDPRTGTSPHAQWPAFDIVAQAMGGLISCTGTADGERVASGPSVGDLYPATMCAVGILAALHHARMTGEGQFVDVAMMDAVMALCESVTWRYSYEGEVQAPRGSAHPSISPFEVFPTADGQCAIAAPTPAQWAHLCRTVGREDLIEDERTRTSPRRSANRELVHEVLSSWTSARTTDDVVAALAGHVPVGPVNDAPALFRSEHVRSREMLVAVDHPGSERPVVTANTPIRFTRTGTGVYRRAPKLGEHTDEVLAELEQRE
ncbi:MAG: CoA transferase [Actinomycetota bacterium]|nr:CoA transferase [Actinomycetota bacterium]